jgi:hypothetical protein
MMAAPATDHWLIRFRLAERTGPGPIRVREGMNSAWTGSNWKFTRPGAVTLFLVAFGNGVAIAVVGRWIWTLFS